MNKLKVRVYIDGANMFYSQKDLGWIFDWKKIKTLIKRRFLVDQFTYYTPLRRESEKQVRQIERLGKWGFTVRTKPPKLIKRKFKANFDVEMSVDIILSLLDGWKGDFVIVSGDSDFSYLIKVLQRRFKRKIFVFSTKRFLSWEVSYLANKCFFLEEYKKQIFLKKWVLTKEQRGDTRKSR